MYWIYDLPHWAGAVLFSVVFVGITSLGVVLMRSWVRRHAADQPDWNGMISTILSAYCVFYGITLALIAVSTYQNFAAADSAVAREAASLGTLYRNVSGYPEPIRGELQDILRDYSEYVIEDAWPAQQRGEIPEGGTVKVTFFQEKLLSFQPETRSEGILHAATIAQFDSFVENRRERLYRVTTGLPAALWFVVIVGAPLNAALTWLFDIKRLIVHLTVAGILSLFVALLVFLIVAMDNPFRGAVSITPEAFEIVQRSLMRPDR